MKESQVFNKKDSQRTVQLLTDPGSGDLTSNIGDVFSNGIYDYTTINLSTGTRYQQFIRNEVVDGAGLAGGFAVDTAGVLWTWGPNDQGQLGDGTTASRSSPISVIGLGSRSISSCVRDTSNSYALDNQGVIWAWGSGSGGALGNNNVMSSSSPTSLPTWRHFVALATGVSLTTTGGALDTNGYAWMWGTGTSGQLGDGGTDSHSSPVSVQGNRQFVVLNRNGRAIDLNNQPFAWGLNDKGQLGDGTTTPKSSPVSVLGIPTTVTKVASGGSHTLFLTKNGTLYAVGQNDSGQLGDGTTVNRSQAVFVNTGANKIIDIGAGTGHSVALDQYGKIWTWGLNSSGQLGNNNTMNWSLPVISIASLIQGPNIPTLSARRTMGLLDSNSYAWTWGANYDGYLGDGTTENKSFPVSVVGGRQWSQFDIMPNGTGFGIDINGYAWTWGLNTEGVLGNNTTTKSSSPVSVFGGRRWLTLRMTRDDGSAQDSIGGLDTNGYAWMWGSLVGGGGGNVMRSSPISVVGDKQFTRLVNPPYTDLFIALDANSYAWTWGNGWYGALGNNQTGIVTTSPVSVVGGRQWLDIQMGGYYTQHTKVLGLDFSSYAWAWGRGSTSSGLGDGTLSDFSSPVSVFGGHQWRKIVVSADYILGGLDNNSYAWTWGNKATSGDMGAIGDGTTFGRSSPVSVLGGRQFSDLQFSYDYFAGLYPVLIGLSSGSVWTCGGNAVGTLGDGTTCLGRSSPVSVLGLTNITSINSKNFPMAFSSTSTVWGWGYQDGSGNLGDKTTTPKSSPVSVYTLIGTYLTSGTPSVVPTLNRFTVIGTNEAQTSALDTDGNVWNWGINYKTLPPVTISVATLVGGPALAENGVNSSVFLSTGGYAWVWGDNSAGQLGLGTTTDVNSPTSLPWGLRWQNIWTTMSGRTFYGIDTAGYPWAWGQNTWGQLGDGTTSSRSTPTSILGGRQVYVGVHPSLSIGAMGSMIAEPLGYVWSWGQITPTLSVSSPISIQVGFQSGWKLLQTNNDTSGRGFSMAIDYMIGQSYAWAWGANASGELGNSTTTSTSSPVTVVSSKVWRDISVGAVGGYNFLIGYDGNGYAWAWGGAPGYGTLGNNTTVSASSPVSVFGGNIWQWPNIPYGKTFKTSGQGNAAGIDTNQYMWSWGPNDKGQLGDGTTTSRSSPVAVINAMTTFGPVFGYNNDWGFALDPDTSNPCMYVTRDNSSCWTWGSNASGLLGDGTTVSKSSPVSALTVGGYNLVTGSRNLYRTAMGGAQLSVWGHSLVGDGTTTSASSPVSVSLAFPVAPIGGNLGDNSISSRSNPVLLTAALHAKNKRG